MKHEKRVESPRCVVKQTHVKGKKSATMPVSTARLMFTGLELPVILVLNRGNGPAELLSQCLGEKLLERHVELLGEDDR